MIKTNRLIIRKYKPDDWNDLYEYLSDEKVVKYEPYTVFTKESSMQEAVNRSNNNDFWAVCLKDIDKLIGNIYLSKQNFETWELGYVFNANYQGKGYATEAARVMLDNVFLNQDARRVVAMCNPLNTASWKLLERLGFRREGHLVKNIYFKTNEQGQPMWSDTYEYGILSDEWLSSSK